MDENQQPVKEKNKWPCLPISKSSSHEQKKRSCFRLLLWPFKWLFAACGMLILVLVALGLGITVSSLVTALVWAITTCVMVPIALAALPVLVVSFLLTRALQFFKHGDDYDTTVHLKVFIRSWIYTGMSSLVILLAIFYGIAKDNHNLKHTMIREKSLTDWLVIYFVVFGIYALNWFLSVLIFRLVPLLPLDHYESGLQVPESVLEIVDCLIFLWAKYEVLKRVPALKGDKILGLQTKNWVEVSILLLIGHNVITLCTRFIVLLLRKLANMFDSGTNKKSKRYQFMEKMMHKKYVVYGANGIRYSINFILSSSMLLITWIFYIGKHLDKTHRAEKVYRIGIWTCVSLLICACLWLMKACLILSWEARKVYNRLEEQILEGGKQLYFLGLIGRHTYDILNLRYDIKNPEKEYLLAMVINIFPMGVIDLESRYHSDSDFEDDVAEKKLFSIRRKKLVKGDLLNKKYGKSTLYTIQQAAYYFLQARETLKNDNFTSEILDKLINGIPSLEQQNDDNETYKRKIRKLVEADENNIVNDRSNNVGDDEDNNSNVENDWKIFEKLLREYTDQSASYIEKIEHWMERARNHFLFLANTFQSSKEVMEVLNQIISWVIIAATFILWILLTEFATTKVLVLIASPLLAATFIFGETGKNMFQGIIYAYMVNPFDVGDLCVIDGVMMEVRTLGIWVTSFSKIGTSDKVIYPTLELSKKNIINHKTEFDWNDRVEIDVPKSLDHKKGIEDLKIDIKKHLHDNKHNYAPSYTCMEVTRNDGNTKIVVSFRHKEKNKEKATYFRNYKDKVESTSMLGYELQDVVNKKLKEYSEKDEHSEDSIGATNRSE